MTEQAKAPLRAAILGSCGDLEFTQTILDEMTTVVDFLLRSGCTEIATGAGQGVPRRFSEMFMDRGGVAYGYSPWPSPEYLTEHPDWEQDPRTTMIWVGGGEQGNFAARDHHTLAGCRVVMTLPWGRPGAGTAREVMYALKRAHVEQVVLLHSTLISPEARRRIIGLFTAAELFKDDKGRKQLDLWEVDALAHRRLLPG